MCLRGCVFGRGVAGGGHGSRMKSLGRRGVADRKKYSPGITDRWWGFAKI
jgi:hypothetical protein